MSETTKQKRENARIGLTALSYRGYEFGKISLGFMDRLLNDADRLATLEAQFERQKNLLRSIIEADPDDSAADGVTVLDVWREEARALLDDLEK